jgi:hypothetical protein
MLERSFYEPPQGLRRFLLSALGVLLIAIQLVALAHVHHEERETTSCALCAVAHAPAIDTAPAPPLERPTRLEITFWIPVGVAPDPPPASAASARASPLA